MGACAAAVAAVLLTAAGAAPASAGSGVALAYVPVGSPVTRDVTYHWNRLGYGWSGDPDPSAHALPAGAPTVRFAFPTSMTAGLDPAGLQLVAVAAGGPGDCPVDVDGLAMDGWTLVVTPAALLASNLGSCVGTTSGFEVRAKGSAVGGSVTLAVDLYLVPSAATDPVQVQLPPVPATYESDTFRTPPTDVPAGAAVDLVAAPSFFTQDGLSAVVRTGGAPWTVAGSALSLSTDRSRLVVTLPTDLPASASDVVVSFATAQPAGAVQIVVPLGVIADPVAAYVTSVYLSVLQRDPEPLGLAQWTTALKRGVPYTEVANSITGSDEFRARLITDAYRAYLGRGPDPIGLRGWLLEMGQGLQIEAMQAGFVASPEYYALAGGDDAGWITRLYRHVLGRDPAQAEVSFWQARLAQGQSRYGVAIGFLYSSEHLTSVVDGYYGELLYRHIDPVGASTWVGLIQHGSRDEQIIAAIVASDEYRGNVPKG